jgi:Zn-dependent protease with chaperone function
LKISGQSSGLLALFATHPPLEQRIARLEQGAF